jgi:hypothetical protein
MDNGLILPVNLMLQDLYNRKSRLVAEIMCDEQSVYIDLRDDDVYGTFSGNFHSSLCLTQTSHSVIHRVQV